MTPPSTLRHFRVNGLHNAGVTSISLKSAPIPQLARSNIFWFADFFANNCERIRVQSVSGTTLTLSQPTRFAHSDDALIGIEHRTLNVTPQTYGAIGTYFVNRQIPAAPIDTRVVQRFMLEMRGHGVRISGGGGGGIYNAFFATEPWVIPDGSHQGEGSLFGSTGTQPTGNVIDNDSPTMQPSTITTAKSFSEISASGGVLTLASAALGTPLVGYPIIFNTIYGETLPAPLVSGKYYRILSWNSSTRAITVAEWTSPTTAITITGSGTGWTWYNFHLGIDFGIEWTSYDGGADTGVGVKLCAKPGAFFRDTRDNYNSTTFEIGGQGCDIINIEVQNGYSSTGLAFQTRGSMILTGAEHTLDYYNGNTAGASSVGEGVINYSSNTLVRALYGEGEANQVDMKAGHNFRVKILVSSRASAPSMTDNTTPGVASWTVDQIYQSSTGSAILMMNDVVSYFYMGNAANDYSHTDATHCANGFRREANGYLEVKNRGPWHVGSHQGSIISRKLRHIFFDVTSNQPNGVLFLPECGGLDGIQFTIVVNTEAAGRTATIKDHLSNTITVITNATQGIISKKIFVKNPSNPTTGYDVSDWMVVNA